ncbi:transposase family protein [Xenococcus sp. PCC 7305]|uniref:IS4 family transposase n=1 Tax=Xenococcus sp. PCC 7305 TaxID=102125 RepID=UPI0002ABCFC3|nr:IS4 family transposase [Xenococcus sp. PCC 7305]ELS03252.1 transposase family protein [Xenococcus sp. PCC 7305]
MPEILALLSCLTFDLNNTSLKHLSVIIQAMLAMTGRVTMLGISRWAGKGGSYRTIQRFFSSPKNWPTLMWVFFRTHCFCPEEKYAIAGDEVVTTKSGHKTYGVDWFFSSLAQRPVKGLAFFALSLVGLEQRQSYPLRIEQVIRPVVKAKASPREPSTQTKGKRGRPKGSKNKDKTQVNLSRELLQIRGMLSALLNTIGGSIPLEYLLLDGKFGHNAAMQMTLQMGLHLVSKLRYDSALFLPYQGSNSRRKYGDKLNPRQMGREFLCQSSTEEDWRTDIYQVQVLHKEFAQPINLVILLKTNIKTQQQGHVLLFSSDLELTANQLIELYSLRFQIELNFRDAKQFWGLEDFMNVSQTAVTNAVNLSFFMVNLSRRLLQDFQCPHCPQFSLLDLKALYRAFKYVEEVIKLLPQKPESILFSRILNQVANLGAIHSVRVPDISSQ